MLESAGIVRSTKEGRESLFQPEPKRLDDAKDYLATVSEQWRGALERLQAFVTR